MFTKSAALYDAIYSKKDYGSEARELEDILAARGVVSGATMLDVACGTGRHLLHLRDRYGTQGLDIDAELLAIAAQRLPGVALHLADMTRFNLHQHFDAVLCLFSSIGYTRTTTGLRRAVGSMAKHVRPGGLLLVEPFLFPDQFIDGHVSGLYAETHDLRVARMSVSRRAGALCLWDFNYLVAEPSGVRHFVEKHALGLFDRDQYEQAFAAAGLDCEFDPVGLVGRGLFIGTKLAGK